MSQRALVLILLSWLGLRLLLASQLGLVADEAYYWTWSQRLDWGYYDHPPAIAGLIRLGCMIFGDSELGVRGLGLILQTLGLGLLIAKAPGDLKLRCLLFLGAPLLALGGMIATPDVPLLLAWGLGLLAIQSRQIWWAGVFCGLAMISKLTGWLLWPILWLSWPSRRDPRLYLAGALAVAVCGPHLLWSAQNDWIGFGFQLRHGLQSSSGELPGLMGLLTYLGGQLALLNPLLAVAGVLWLRQAWRQQGGLKLGPEALWFWATLMPFAAFGAASVVGHSEPNWPAAGALALFVGLSQTQERLQRLVWSGAWLGAFFSALALTHARIAVYDLPKDPTHALYEGRALGETVRNLQPSGAVLCNRYQEAAWVAFYGGVEATTVPGMGRMNQFDLWLESLPDEAYYIRPGRYTDKMDPNMPYRGHGSPWRASAYRGERRITEWQLFRVSGPPTETP